MRIALAGLLAVLLVGCGGATSTSPSPAPTATGGPTQPTSVAPSPSSGGVAEPTPPARGSPDRPGLMPGASALVVTDDLRVRSRPWVGQDSLKYTPLLGYGTAVEILEGPVQGSGYWWYRIAVGVDLRCTAAQQAAGICFYEFSNGTNQGWVAAADYDGTPWLQAPSACAASAVTGWPSVSRCGVTLAGQTPTHPADWTGDLVIPIRISGLAPGSSVAVAATADWSVTWVCGVEPSPCGQIGCGPAETEATAGRARLIRSLTSGSSGSISTKIVLRAGPPPDPKCSADPWGLMHIAWTSIRIVDAADGLSLTPPVQGWGYTF